MGICIDCSRRSPDACGLCVTTLIQDGGAYVGEKVKVPPPLGVAKTKDQLAAADAAAAALEGSH